MPAPGALRQPSRTLVIAAAAVPLALAALAADDLRVRRQLDTARRDPLTGLPGRDALMARTGRLARTCREQLHVMIADADGLKSVNDTLGHAAGDTLIATIGHRLGAWAAARGGLAARLGGDEFGAVLLLPPTATNQELAGLRELLAQPVDHDGQTLHPAVSIGTARAADVAADLPDAAGAARLLRGADMAMYRVKTREQPAGYVATRHDAYTPSVHGRRPGRPGTHLPLA
ncbi:GGDEF domain-containing protein [Streptomyces adustus]|uniref:GGDEF domain-containing protein n=1 Tax=Streptomyces adustus TaxID=1609272 RepID=A0A5N8VSQ9_9ACTN|nr:GGDEF domain-containing protein [Streptomyces adustus]MPY38293.1 GGDEF domain-containing protein [Streptomyces adustus]